MGAPSNATRLLQLRSYQYVNTSMRSGSGGVRCGFPYEVGRGPAAWVLPPPHHTLIFTPGVCFRLPPKFFKKFLFDFPILDFPLLSFLPIYFYVFLQKFYAMVTIDQNYTYQQYEQALQRAAQLGFKGQKAHNYALANTDI